VWHDRSARRNHAYRRVEALVGRDSWGERFASVRQTYERPDAIAAGSCAALLAQARLLPGGDPDLPDRLSEGVMRRFAWSDGVSDRLSDAYRGGMTVSFILSTLAIVGGVAYLPFGAPFEKWHFALFEAVLLTGILVIIAFGVRSRLHRRWFETRRLAEYLRHSPLMLLIGAMRPTGRWPRGTGATWPEFLARQIQRDVGLPEAALTQEYLRAFLAGPLSGHLSSQAAYHAGKAKRLAAVHHRLDRLSLRCFQLAVVSVSAFLLLRGGASLGLVSGAIVDGSSKVFTVLGVLFPTFGAGIAGVRYFGDFQRFGEISRVAARKFEAVDSRVAKLLEAPASRINYGQVVDLVRATDEAVIGELESWQSVFRSKEVTVPV
jgi:hypothetical protein